MNFSADKLLHDLRKEKRVSAKPKYISHCKQIRPFKKYDVKIPKIIMQTWKTYKVPDKWKVSVKSIKSLMPGWKYVLMSDEDNRNFVQQHFPDFLPYYDAFPYNIQRADAIRYCWLYINGGIYMDLDFEIQKPLDELFTADSETYLVHSGNVGAYVTNSFMASKPRVQMWLDMIEYMKKDLAWFYLGKHVQVMNTTGPIALTHVVKENGVSYFNLSKKLIMPCSICNISCATCEAFMRPLEGSSWISYDTMFYNFFLCYWKYLVAFLVCLLLIILAFWILYKLGLMKDSVQFHKPWKYL